MSVNVGSFRPSPNFESECLKELNRLKDQILAALKISADSAFNVPGLLTQIANSVEFNNLADIIAKRFFSRCVYKNDDTYRKAFFGRAYEIFKGLTGDEDLLSFIRSQIEEKANLFRTIPTDLAKAIIPHVNEWGLEGRTSKGIFEDLKTKIPALLDFQIRRIARTEISKTLTDITRYKCGKGQVNIYQWKASGGERGDGRTRNSHRKMANVLVFWGEPPAPEDLFPNYSESGKRQKNTLGHYHAGCCPNCRCVAMPVVSVSDIEFPAKIYMGGAIRKIGKRELLELLKVQNEFKPAPADEGQNKGTPGGDKAVDVVTNPPTVPTAKPKAKRQAKPLMPLQLLKNKITNLLVDSFGIPKTNIYLEHFNEEETAAIGEVFENLKTVKAEIEKEAGFDFEISSIRHLGSTQEFEKKVNSKKNREKIEEAFLEKYRQANPGVSDERLIIPAKKAARNYLKKLGYSQTETGAFIIGNIWGLDENIRGLYINPIANRLRKARNKDDHKHSPPGTTNIKGTINHEIGHSLDFVFNLSSDKKIQELYNEDLKRWLSVKTRWYDEVQGLKFFKSDFEEAFEEAKKEYQRTAKKGEDFDFLSGYAFENQNTNAKDEARYYEFIAEATSEILTVGYENARPRTKKIWDEILRVIKESKKKK